MHQSDSTYNRNLNHDVATNRVWLAIVAALLAVAGVGLATIAGPPRVPGQLPSPERLLQVLGGTSLPLDGVAVLLVDVAWLAWAWTALSLVLELLVLAAEVLAHGRGSVRALRQLADRLSVPLVRRSVAAAFAVQVLGRTVSVAAAQPLPPTEQIMVARSSEAPEAKDAAADSQDIAGAPTFVVRPGDTLWSIAEQAYGSGVQYRRLVDANVGRTMADGQVFSRQGVIQPGWRLLAPGANWDSETQDADGGRWYTVRPGDTLSSIAASAFGDTARWQELFDLNRGAMSPDRQHALVEPNTIWPGLRLQLPTSTSADQNDDAPPDAAPSELLVASAPAPVAETQSLAESNPAGDADLQSEGSPTPAPSPPPLLRTAHALQPVVLDPADTGPSDPPPMDPSAPDPGAADPPSADPAADAEVSVPPRSTGPSLPTVPLVVGGLGLAGIAGLGFGARRLRRLRPLPQEPETDVVVEGGFAEAQLARDLTRGLHGISSDPLAALVAQLKRFLHEHNLDDIDVVAARYGRSSTTLTLRCSLAAQPILLDLAATFGERLEADVEACISADQDVVLRLIRLRKTRLLPTADQARASLPLVQLGVLYDRQVYSADLGSLGHVLIVSLPGHGADTILTSLVATLSAHRSPDQLQVWIMGARRALPAPIFELPHLVRSADPADAVAVGEAVEQLRAEVDRRSDQDHGVRFPELVVVVPELASLGEHSARLALLADRATTVGIHLVVACTDPEAATDSPLAACFGTRMVMRMETEEASVALLGVADAAYLGGGGRLLLRLDGREPVELYGYQIAAEHLERLAQLMRHGYSAPSHTSDTDAAELPPPPPDKAADGGALDASEASEAVVSETDEPPLQETTSLVPTKMTDATGVASAEPSAPIQVRCFGLPRVECHGHLVWPHGGGDAKPWELLLYLATQPADGVTHASAMEALWPAAKAQAMADDANHRFRQLRYRLRRQLQQVANAPANEGIAMDRRGLRLDPAIVHSDAQEFLTLEREVRVHQDPQGHHAIAQLERMRSLYVGDLLDGPDVRRYAWVDERDDSGVTLREHFRRLFQDACARLAAAYTSAGRIQEAIDVYHDLTDMDPSDERLFQALFRLHAAAGDLAGLKAEERRMQTLLRDLALDLDPLDTQVQEPDRETMEEFHRLCASLRDRERNREREHEAATASV